MVTKIKCIIKFNLLYHTIHVIDFASKIELCCYCWSWFRWTGNPGSTESKKEMVEETGAEQREKKKHSIELLKPEKKKRKKKRKLFKFIPHGKLNPEKNKLKSLHKTC